MGEPENDTPLPPAHHILRYVSKKHVDSGAVNGGGFLPRASEINDGASCNWMECFVEPVANQCAEIVARKRITYEKRGKLARLNVGQTTRHILEQATMKLALAIVHDPLPPDEPYEADPSHALIKGLPAVGSPDGELVGDLFLDCVLETFDPPIG